MKNHHLDAIVETTGDRIAGIGYVCLRCYLSLLAPLLLHAFIDKLHEFKISADHLLHSIRVTLYVQNPAS